MTIERFARRAQRAGIKVVVAGASASVRQELLAHHVRPLVTFCASVAIARASLQAETGTQSARMDAPAAA
jgi:hypothetical protein